MLHFPNKAYFYGEFGCLNYAILGHLEDKELKISISTQPDYFKLMKMKCKSITKAEDFSVYRNNCKGSGFGLSINDSVISELESDGFVPLNKILKFRENKCIIYLKPIKTPLKVDLGLKEQYISISCRKRTHEPERNLSINDWYKIIDMIKKHSNLPIIAHGMHIDTYDMSKIGIRRVESIEESIAYMNKSKVFIASMSGIAQMASNCACGVIQIGNTSRHIDYDPFNKGCIAVEKQDFENAFLDFLK